MRANAKSPPKWPAHPPVWLVKLQHWVTSSHDWVHPRCCWSISTRMSSGTAGQGRAGQGRAGQGRADVWVYDVWCGAARADKGEFVDTERHDTLRSQDSRVRVWAWAACGCPPPSPTNSLSSVGWVSFIWKATFSPNWSQVSWVSV
jgi:hypothetical protein